MPIGAFGGVEEYVARVAGLTYMIDAARRLTARAVDLGEKPAVISAIVKRYTTEAARGLINDAMDVFGGSGISRGPRNVIAKSYEQVPIGVTVEGANILTRTMIIFGQGAIRCHPYVRHEMDAAARNDLAAFDRGFFGHVGYVFSNAARSLILGLTAGRLVRPPVAGPMAPVFGRLSRLSSAFALAADVAMGTLGGALKRQEKLNGRLADALAWLYLASAAVKRFIADGQPASDRPYAMWVADTALFEIERALAGFLDNLPNRVAAAAVRPLMFPLGRRHRGPSDRLGARVAQGIMAGGEARARLTGGMYVPPPTEPGLGRLEDALQKLIAAAPVHVKLRHAVKDRKLPARPVETILDRAREAGVISEDEHRVASAAEAARDEAMTVDAFKQLAQVLASA
jgi:acyl-CoA dehydrogenase